MTSYQEGNIVNIQGNLEEERLVAGPACYWQEGSLSHRCHGEDSGKKGEKEGDTGSGSRTSLGR